MSRLWLAAVLIAVAGCGRPDIADRPVPADKVVEFAALYKQNCSGCHGADGKLGPAPPLNDALFLAIVPDAVLEQVITVGRHGTPMPAFARAQGGSLTDEQVHALASGLKSRWGAAELKNDGVPTYAASGSGSPKNGAEVFARACSVCHGDNGKGVLDGDRRVNAINDPVFLALISDQALRRYVITGRPDFGMPNYAEPRPGQPDFHALAAEQINDVVALLASWRLGTSDGKRVAVRNPDLPPGVPDGGTR